MSSFMMLRTRCPFFTAGHPAQAAHQAHGLRIATAAQEIQRPHVAHRAAGLHHEFNAHIPLDVQSVGFLRVLQVIGQPGGQPAQSAIQAWPRQAVHLVVLEHNVVQRRRRAGRQGRAGLPFGVELRVALGVEGHQDGVVLLEGRAVGGSGLPADQRGQSQGLGIARGFQRQGDAQVAHAAVREDLEADAHLAADARRQGLGRIVLLLFQHPFHGILAPVRLGRGELLPRRTTRREQQYHGRDPWVMAVLLPHERLAQARAR
jgi:hypothetical protein